MWCQKLHVGLLVFLPLAACSDPGMVPFPPGAGEQDAEANTEASPDVTTSLDDEREDAGASSAWPDTEPDDASSDTAIEPNPEAVPDAGSDDDPDAELEAEPDAPGDVAQEPPLCEPAVSIVSPDDGAFVQNPVTFKVGARNVEFVQILADDYPLSEPWDPFDHDTLEFTFIGLDYAREIRLLGLDGAEQPLVEHAITITVVGD